MTHSKMQCKMIVPSNPRHIPLIAPSFLTGPCPRTLLLFFSFYTEQNRYRYEPDSGWLITKRLYHQRFKKKRAGKLFFSLAALLVSGNEIDSGGLNSLFLIT